MGIDPGSVRVGVALSDETRTLATPLMTLAAGPGLVGALAALVRENDVRELVVGLPRRLDGSEGPEAEAARGLGGELHAATGLPATMWDERMTSRIAERTAAGDRRGRGRGAAPRSREQVRARREATDRAAAAVLLQSYLDSVGRR